MLPVNGARGEVVARLGGREVRLCVTLGALARLESHFAVSGLEALGQRLRAPGAADLMAVLQALILDEADLSAVSPAEAIAAVTAAFAAMAGDDHG